MSEGGKKGGKKTNEETLEENNKNEIMVKGKENFPYLNASEEKDIKTETKPEEPPKPPKPKDKPAPASKARDKAAKETGDKVAAQTGVGSGRTYEKANIRIPSDRF